MVLKMDRFPSTRAAVAGVGKKAPGMGRFGVSVAIASYTVAASRFPRPVDPNAAAGSTSSVEAASVLSVLG